VTPVPSAPTFASLLQDFFCQRLMSQRNVSARTVASYRDTFRLLLRFAETRTRKSAAALAMVDLDAPFILAFLDHLERERGNSIRTRNARLTAIRSFLHYVAHQDPISLPMISRVLAIPTKRFDQPVLGFLSRLEVDALLAAPDRSTWSGHRDQVMFTTLYNTGARVSEVIGLRRTDVEFDGARCVHIQGKGRKQRVVPLWSSTIARLKEWIARMEHGQEAPLFPNRDGLPLSRSGVEKRLRLAVAKATKVCPSLVGRRISPHTLRHTTAMHLLQSGVDMTVIALWLGHETPATTHLYVEADLTMKEQALKRVAEPPTTRLRYQAKDRLLAFLDRL
jgi:site-specific recombinase XerD